MRYAGLVVHGIGEQQKGDTIKIVVKHFYEFIVKSRLGAKPRVAATPEGVPGPVRATLDFHAQGQHYLLEFAEIWWARSFHPPPLGTAALFFIRWGLREFWRLLERIGDFFLSFARRPRQGVSRTAALLRRADPVWLQMLLVDVVLVASAPLWLPLLLALWVLDAGPIKRFVPAVVREVHRMLVSIVTTRLGDVSVYLDDAWEASRITSAFEEELEKLVSAYKRGELDGVFVIAHSMGAVVAFEGLLRKSALLALAPGDKPFLRFITIGAALNRAWRMLPATYDYRLKRQLPEGVIWTDIWASHDPVPVGGIEQPQWAPRGHVDELEVVNQEDIFSDHGAYWNNAEEVVARMLGDIAGITVHPPLDVRYRRRRVRLLALLKTAAWASAPAVFLWLAISEWSKEFAQWIEGTAILEIPLTWFTAGGPGKPNSFVDMLGGDWLLEHGILPFLAAAFLAIAVAFCYSTVVKWAWDLWDKSVKYR